MSAPSEIELMMFFDGELDEPRRSEVAAFVERDAHAAAKTWGLDQVGRWLRDDAERVADAGNADGIADAVMGAIAEGVTTDEAKVVPIAPKTPTREDAKRPANDNGRLILGLAGLAAAAAMALFVWGSGETAGPSALPTLTTGAPDVKTAPPLPSSAERVVVAPDPSEDADDDGPGASVASVDFGEQTGAIYYVAGNTKGMTTTVVWLTDE